MEMMDITSLSQHEVQRIDELSLILEILDDHITWPAYRSRAKEGSVDPLEVPLGPMTRARAKRFKEALHVLI